MKKFISIILCIIICTSCQKQGLDANAFIEPVEFPMMERVVVGDLVVQVVDTAIEEEQVKIRFALTAITDDFVNITEIAKFKVIQDDKEWLPTVKYEFFTHSEGEIYGGELFYATVVIDGLNYRPFEIKLNDENIEFKFAKEKSQYIKMDDSFDLHFMNLNSLNLIFDSGSLRDDRFAIPMVVSGTSENGIIEESVDIYFQDENEERYMPKILKVTDDDDEITPGVIFWITREEVELGEHVIGEGEHLFGEYKLIFTMKDVEKGHLIVKDKTSDREVKIHYEKKEMAGETLFFFEPPYDGFEPSTITVNE